LGRLGLLGRLRWRRGRVFLAEHRDIRYLQLLLLGFSLFLGLGLWDSVGATMSTAIDCAVERCGCTSVEIRISASTEKCTSTDAATPERMACPSSTLLFRCSKRPSPE